LGDLEPFAEVKTFHSYCKKILHEQKGRVELRSYLTEIIQDDALLLNTQFYNFDTKFQTLEEGKEIDFYLRRGDYYEAVGFNDSVFRLYKIFQVNHDIIPSFDNILIDEFQDFNRLEVAFIKELEEKGTIIIVGDDDQAVYDGRSSSPDFLRDLYESKRFVIFPLPFCSRSTQVIVDVTNMLVKKAISSGYFKGHIPKEYECYLPDKEVDSLKYPKIVTSQLKTIKSIPKYIKKEILNISPEDIAESYVEGKEYPTVLIIGQRHYLAEIEKQLKKDFTQVYYSPIE
jgi:superfamily I DNA/RNA helicase